MSRFIRGGVGVMLVLGVAARAIAEEGGADLPFESRVYVVSRVLPDLKRTGLDLRIVGIVKTIQPVTEDRKRGRQSVVALPIRIENRSKRTIAAYVAHEWYGGEWPQTDLYAAVRNSGNENAHWTSHEVYLSGEMDRAAAYTWRPGESHEFSLRLNWPGTGSQPFGSLLGENEPGKYTVKVFLVFRSPRSYHFEYAESAEMEIEVEQP